MSQRNIQSYEADPICIKIFFFILGGKSLKLCINSLPNDKISDLSKLKAFADDKINTTHKLKFASGQTEKENSVVKGENAGYQHFLLFPQCFHKYTFSGSLKVGIEW